MVTLNNVVRRRQIALLITLILGLGAGGGASWMVSEMSLQPGSAKRGALPEPVPDMTGVVNQMFDDKIQRAAIAQAQTLNQETQAQLGKLSTDMQSLSRDLKSAQGRIRELTDENALLQTQFDAARHFDSLHGEPVPVALAPQGSGLLAGQCSSLNTRWPVDHEQMPASPVMTPVIRPGQMDVQEFPQPKKRADAIRYPWIHSGSFAQAVVIEGADANASVTGDKNTVPMQLRLTGKVQRPNDGEYDLRGCFVTLEAYGDVSSERALVRTRSISCQLGEDTVDQKIAGHVSFMGKNGIKGEVVMRNGQILLYAGAAGFIDGIGKGIEKAASPTVGVGASASITAAAVAQAGLGGATSSAAKTLSDYYIKRAEHYHPIIPIGAGNDVTLVFQDGFQLETLDAARAKAEARQTPRMQAPAPFSASQNTTDMLKQLETFQVGEALAPVPDNGGGL